MNPCKSYWVETTANTPTKTKSKKGDNSVKIWLILPISNLTCILQWYKVLQSLNEITASLQKLLSGNEKCDKDTNGTDDDTDGQMIPMCLPCYAGDTKIFQNVICWNFYPAYYSRLSLSRIPRDSLKYFEISVVQHIRFAELRKK